MSIFTQSIKSPVGVAVGVIIAVLAGLAALFSVPVQLTPEVKKPLITVTTRWFGASPEEIEKDIVEEQEKYLKSVETLVRMTSESSDGQGIIYLEFPAGTDLNAVLVKVTNKLNEVPSYPENADKPVVTTSGPFDNAIAWFVFKATNDSIDLPAQKTFVEDVIKPRLERVEGVASINTFGGLEEELHVIFDAEKLATSGVTIGELAAALRNDNRDISAGDFSEGKRRYVVRTLSRYETIADVGETIIAERRGAAIRVKDVADVRLGFQKPFALVRHKGKPSLAINAQRQVGANVLQVMDGLMVELEKINKEILAPRGMSLENVYTETTYINQAVDKVYEDLVLGSLLAIAILFMFLRSTSSVLVIAVSIPISIISGFVAMYAFGRTINVISLAGMAFAVGMVVDDAIVVLENIYRHLQMGKSRIRASLDGTREVWGAVLSSTLTTIAVFMPVVFIQERAAQLFQDIAIALSCAMAMSLLVSVTVIPTISSRILKLSSALKEADAHQNTWVERFSSRVVRLVDYVSLTRLRRATTIISITVISLAVSWLALPPSEYLPNGNQNFIFGFILPPPGYNLDEMVLAGKNIESQLSDLYETDEKESEKLPGGGVSNFFYVAFPGQAFMGLVAREPERISELLPLTNAALATIPGAFGFAQQASIFSDEVGGTRSVRIDVSGPELPQILSLATGVFMKISQVIPGSNSRPIPGLDLGNPEVQVIPDRTRATDAGINATDIGMAVNAMVDGSPISTFRANGREIDMRLSGRDNLAGHTQDVAQLPLATPSGKIITVGDVAEIRQMQGPVQINHVERQRTVSIETVLPRDFPLETAVRTIEDSVISPMRTSGQLSGVYDIRTAGTADDLSKLRVALRWNFVAALLLTYLLLAALFESFLFPLVIMFTVPLATVGGVLGLRVTQLFDPNQQLDILTMLGFVILIGTVVKNSILIVHQAQNFMAEGMDQRKAVKESVRIRVRPIFMSTGTSILGMLPLVVMPGAGSELYRGLGAVVIGGLAFSTIVTLLLTPLVFSFFLEWADAIRVRLGMQAKSYRLDKALEEE